MIKIENVRVTNFESAFRGMRNPMNSWHLSDSAFGLLNTQYSDIDYEVTNSWVRTETEADEWSPEYEEAFEKYNNWLMRNGILAHEVNQNTIEYAFIGPKDMNLAQRLLGGGSDDHKFMRQINISMDITCHHTWWAEFDTYKVGTVRNSCSKMHKIHVKGFEREMFSCEGIDSLAYDFPQANKTFEDTLITLEELRKLFNETQDRRYWRAMIEILPMGFNIKATVSFNYQVARAMYHARNNHKVFEWRDLCKVFEELPYGKELICYKKPKTMNDANHTALLYTILHYLNIDYKDRPTDEILNDITTKYSKENKING